MTRPTLAEIRRAAALIHGMTEADIQSRSRVRQYVDARQDAWIVSREAGYSLPQIAAAWGKDPTTVHHSINVRAHHANSAAMAPMVADLAGTLAATRDEMVALLRASPRMSQDEIRVLLARTVKAQDAISALAARATGSGKATKRK